MAFSANTSSFLSGNNLKVTVSVYRDKKSKSNAKFDVSGAATGNVTISAGSLSSSKTFTSNITKTSGTGPNYITVRGNNFQYTDSDIRIQGKHGSIPTGITLNQYPNPVYYNEDVYITYSNQDSSLNYEPGSGFTMTANTNKIKVKISGYVSKDQRDYRYAESLPYLEQEKYLNLRVKLNAPYEYYYKYYGDSYWTYGGSSDPDNPPGTRYEGNVAKCSGYIDSDIGGTSYNIILNTPIISIKPDTTQLYGTPILAEVISYDRNPDAGVPPGTEYNWSGDIGTKTTTDSKISFELLESYMTISCYCTCYPDYAQSAKSASVTTGRCRLNKPEIIVSSLTDNTLSSIIRDNVPYTNINEIVSWVIYPYGRTTTIRNPEGLSTQYTLYLYKDNTNNHNYTGSKLKPKWEKQSNLFINPYDRYIVGGLLRQLQNYVPSEPNFIPIKVLSCPVNMNNFTEKDIPSAIPYTPFIPQFKDKFGQIISEDSVILIRDNIKVQWGTFSPKYFLGNFNYAKVELYNIDDEQTTAVYYLDNNPDKTNNLNIDLSILPTTNPLDGSNYIIPGKHYMVRLTCGYKYGTNSNEVLFEPQYAGIGNYKNSNIFECKSFILGGAPNTPEIIAPNTAVSSQYSQSEYPRIMFKLSKPVNSESLLTKLELKTSYSSDDGNTWTTDNIYTINLVDKYENTETGTSYIGTDDAFTGLISAKEGATSKSYYTHLGSMNAFKEFLMKDVSDGILFSLRLKPQNFNTSWSDWEDGDQSSDYRYKIDIICTNNLNLSSSNSTVFFHRAINHRTKGAILSNKDMSYIATKLYRQLAWYSDIYKTSLESFKANQCNNLDYNNDNSYYKDKVVNAKDLTDLTYNANENSISIYNACRAISNYQTMHNQVTNESVDEYKLTGYDRGSAILDLSKFLTKVNNLTDNYNLDKGSVYYIIKSENSEYSITRYISDNPDYELTLDDISEADLIDSGLSGVNLLNYGIHPTSSYESFIVRKVIPYNYLDQSALNYKNQQRTMITATESKDPSSNIYASYANRLYYNLVESIKYMF